MWCVALIFIAVASCNANDALSSSVNVVELPGTGDNRIIGGSATTIQQYPFTVQVIYVGQFICGGSLLTTVHVLSAGHCFVDDYGNLMSAARYGIRVGTTNLNTGGTLHAVSYIRVHERYNIPIRDNDVAMVLMGTPVNLATSIARPASIPVQGSVVPDNASVTAVGWGLTNVNSSYASSVLNEVTIRKINLATCQNRYLRLQALTGYQYPVTTSMLCAGILDVGGKDACQGDSGGPLLYNGVVVGITSWGAGCAEAAYPGVSARVASYTNWIVSAVQTSGVGGVVNTTVPPVLNPGGNTGALSSTVGLATLLAPLLYLILSV